ncbi:hypothetical protein D3C85_1717580 [compost metagenome]
MLLDELLIARHVQQQVHNAVLLGDPDAPLGHGGRRRGQRQHGKSQRQAGAGGGLDQSIP